MIQTAAQPPRRRGPKPKEGPKAEKHLAMRVTEAALQRFQRLSGEDSYPETLNRLMDRWEGIA